jgi:hypothetical protein
VTIIKHDFQKTKETDKPQTEQTKNIPDYQLRIELGFSSPLIWRRVKVPGTFTLSDLNKVIRVCFCWEKECTHRFLVGKNFYGPGGADQKKGLKSDSDVQLHEIENVMGFIFTYLYDAGSGWECEISLEDIIPSHEHSNHPILIAGDRACPPAKFDDIHEFQNLLARLDDEDFGRERVLAEYDLDGTYDPEHCDTESINAQLSAIF